MNVLQSRLLRAGLLVAMGGCLSCLFTGCTSVPLAYSAGVYKTPVASKPVDLVVTDERPYILNGKEPVHFIGHVRGGYGNMVGYSTTGKIALAKQLETDLSTELKALGFVPGHTGAQRSLRVVVKDFNFDGYMGGAFWYEIDVAVVDASNAVIAEQTLKEKHKIRANLRGAHYAIRGQVPKLYEQLIRQMVSENPKILQALGVRDD